MQCMNKQCEHYDPEWLYNCGNSVFAVLNDCPDHISESTLSYKWCIVCGYRYVEKGSDFCRVCKMEMLAGAEKKDTLEDKSEPQTAPKNNAQEGKPKMHLIPLDLLKEFLVPAYEEGLIKYFEESWRLGFKMSDMMDGLQRHMESFYYQGEDLDQETLDTYGIKKTHLGAALFCILGMCNTLKNYPELDDRTGKKDRNRKSLSCDHKYVEISTMDDFPSNIYHCEKCGKKREEGE